MSGACAVATEAAKSKAKALALTIRCVIVVTFILPICN